MARPPGRAGRSHPLEGWRSFRRAITYAHVSGDRTASSTGRNDSPDRRRRRLVNWLAGGSAAAFAASVFYPVARYLSPPRIPEAATDRIEAGRIDDPELAEKGYKIVRFGAEPVILVRTAQGDYRAFAATCTHLDCIVEFRPDRQLLWCNCHDGRFDLTGRNVGGPPPRPLERYQVHVVAGRGDQPDSLVVERA